MDAKFIYFKRPKFGDFSPRNEYEIFYKKEKIGEIFFLKKKRIFIIGYVSIFKEYRNKGYGYLVIEYILSHYKVNCIVGETLLESRGFWKKCIQKYNGQRKNVKSCDNCTSSFIIPKYSIREDELLELLDIGYQLI